MCIECVLKLMNILLRVMNARGCNEMLFILITTFRVNERTSLTNP